MSFQSINDACRAACEAVGVVFHDVPADGRFHTADLADDPRGKNDARIKVFPDRQGGLVWNHKSGERKTFFLNNNRESGQALSPAERQRIQAEQQRRQAELTAQHDKAAQRAQAIWHAARPAPDDHPYLVRKQVKSYGLRVTTWRRTLKDDRGNKQQVSIDNTLLVPMYDASGSLRSLQAIFPEKHPLFDRDKDFLPGGGRAGLFFWIGPKTDTVLIAEGYATAATLHLESSLRTYIVFAANNLMAVGLAVREKLPAVEIIFCADNDEQTKGNPGLNLATAAAEAVGGSVAVPPVAGDFNDYAQLLAGADHE
ncbi:MAG: toprim domain-containing protein [Methylobacter sp.]